MNWIVIVFDPTGDQNYDGVYGAFPNKTEATLWGKKNIPSPVNWRAHQIQKTSEFKAAEWESNANVRNLKFSIDSNK